jgi:hypothetical protein
MSSENRSSKSMPKDVPNIPTSGAPLTASASSTLKENVFYSTPNMYDHSQDFEFNEFYERVSFKLSYLFILTYLIEESSP